jgi:hypothetical protein
MLRQITAARTCQKQTTENRALKFVRGDDYTPETEIAGTRNEQVAFIVVIACESRPADLQPRNASFEDDGKKNHKQHLGGGAVILVW